MLNITASGLLGPVVALNAWTLVMEVWMYAVIIPVSQEIKPTPATTKSQLEAQTPASARWKKDNFNHLMEQPTQFYAIALTLAIIRGGQDEDLDVLLAWLYMGTRVVHSLVQVTSNALAVRFCLFAFSSSLLAVMVARAAMELF
ncbi:uncharacterized protein N7483_004251 [Penicillium malachiteum]|uniref:uncharacterized protein n=1 Tax=Penicillium malachiteum TaxID=1324776 RepID=UPI0025469A1F|nr:uncharacterized protein N7483_004251 [Penicillium malachiteum]KAJ5729743.1 hypothetical protein N7483_004251 [Penicillium malachiteum]